MNSHLHHIRHSVAHIMAQAVLEMFPEAKIAIGPSIENGFYYDFDLPRPLTPEDLEKIEERMRQIIKGKHPFIRREVTPEEARQIFRNQPYKLELIDDILSHGTDEYGNPLPEGEQPKLTTYKHDTFEDLCRGPHVEHTGQIPADAFKLLNVAGAYWRGDERRPMLQRVYGTAWETPEELEHYLWQIEEAKKRDHRVLGKQLELFHLDPTAPGMPYWLPKGMKVINLLLDFWREEHEARGYMEVSTPQINKRELFEISGHWEHYKDNMFVIPIDEDTIYCVKPMNCPNAMVIYNLKTHSYRDLPLRLSDADILYRKERSGQLHGLLRVQRIQQDDAHIFVTEDQIEEEIERILEIADRFYGVFGLKYTARLSTRPDTGFIGDIETWNKAEESLRSVLDKRWGAGGYLIGEGEGAFYGPKIDIMMEDAIGRTWQMGTIQLDFQLPARFGCEYVDKDGSRKTPVVIHRVIYGSLERFVGILIEHTKGAFPVWLSPVQVKVIPITGEQIPYAEEIMQCFCGKGLRTEIDVSRGTLNEKIRNAQIEKIPYMVIVGKREVDNREISVRLRSGENIGTISVQDFVSTVLNIISQKKIEIWH